MVAAILVALLNAPETALLADWKSDIDSKNAGISPICKHKTKKTAKARCIVASRIEDLG